MQTPVRQTPWKRTIGIAAWTAAAALWGGGCQRDVEQADIRVRQEVQKADEKLASRDGRPEGIQILQKATKEAASSNIAKVHANAELALAELIAGDVLIPRLDENRAKVSSLLARIDAVAGRVQNNNLTLAGFRAREPKGALDAVKKITDSVQGSGKAAWIEADQGPIPSLAAVKEQINSLSADIQKLNDERKKLVDEQSAADQQARDLFLQADQASGQKSVDLFTQASGSRKTAMERSIQIDGIDAKLLPLQQQLAVATGQKTQLEAAAAAIQKQSEELTKGWTDTQEQIKSQAAANDTLVGSAAAAGGAPASQPKSASDSLAQLGAELATTLADVDKLRKDAEAHYKNAQTAVEQALKAAKSVESAYGATLLANNQAPQKDAWQAIIESHKPASLTLRRAEVQQRLADLYAGAARDANAQAKTLAVVKTALDAGGLTMPDSLADKGAADAATTYHKQAEDAFAAADADLLNVIQMPSSGDLVKSAVASARVARIIELYAHAQFLMPQDQKQGGDLMGEAKQIVADLQTGTAPLPAFLPPELTPPPPATTEPATPATAPATAPAAGAAPAPAPAPGTPGAAAPVPQ